MHTYGVLLRSGCQRSMIVEIQPCEYEHTFRPPSIVSDVTSDNQWNRQFRGRPLWHDTVLRTSSCDVYTSFFTGVWRQTLHPIFVAVGSVESSSPSSSPITIFHQITSTAPRGVFAHSAHTWGNGEFLGLWREVSVLAHWYRVQGYWRWVQMRGPSDSDIFVGIVANRGMDFKKGGSTVFLATEFRFITCLIIFIFNLSLGPYSD